jgi:hypothetical protein
MNPAFVTTLALIAQIAAAPERELRPNEQYDGGTRVQSSATGISFTLPEGWIGAFKEQDDKAVMVLGSNTVQGIGMVILVSGQTSAQVAQRLNDTQDLGDGVVLQPVGAVETDGPRITARYRSQMYVGRALAILGSGLDHVIYVYLGPQANESLYGELVEALGGSTRFRAPVPQAPQTTPAPAPGPAQAPSGPAGDWTRFLNGLMLKYFSSYNSGGASGGISEERTFHFCSDGSFAYLDEGLATINVPGGSASSGGNGRVVGSWRVESATDASAVVLLNKDDGGVDRLRIELNDGKTFVNGDRWFRDASQVCR